MMLKVKQDEKPWNHKWVYRIYRALGFNIKIKPRKRIPKGEAKIFVQPIKANICWSIDFMADTLHCGRKVRIFNAIDDYNHEAILIKPGFAMPSARVISLLECIAAERGYPEMFHADNGTEFRVDVFKDRENSIYKQH